MDKFPTKRDYWYGFGIAVIALIFLLVSFVVNPSRLNSELGLASTLASIILSVIAIIYTLVDSSNNKKTSAKIIEASETISSVTTNIQTSSSNLTSLIEQLSKLDMLNRISCLETAVKSVDENVATVLKNSLDIFANANKTIQPPNVNVELKKLSKILVNSLNPVYSAKELLYIVKRLIGTKTELQTVLDIAVEAITRKDSTIDKEFLDGVYMAILGILTFLGCYSYTKENYFTDFNEELNEIMQWVEANEKEFVEKVNILLS